MSSTVGDYYEEEYEVEKLVMHCYDSKGNLQYKVKWLDFPEGSDTWQTLEDVCTAPEAIRNFQDTLSRVARTKHDASLKRMLDEAPDGSSLKSGNVTEMLISVDSH
ncbi:hypothetical protein BGZ93_001996 [Podila epicladia]|nr:hypothetical protein BGZ93_001996 [Podila epicladia]